MKRCIAFLLILGVLCLIPMGCTACNHNKEKGMKDHDVFERLQGVTVTTMDGQDVVLTSLWADRRVALVFLRHYG